MSNSLEGRLENRSNMKLIMDVQSSELREKNNDDKAFGQDVETYLLADTQVAYTM